MCVRDKNTVCKSNVSTSRDSFSLQCSLTIPFLENDDVTKRNLRPWKHTPLGINEQKRKEEHPMETTLNLTKSPKNRHIRFNDRFR